MRNWLAAGLCLLVLSTMSVPAQSLVTQLAERGWRAVNQGDADAAAAAFGEALSMRPRDPVLHLGAGVAAHLRGREHDATVFLQKAIQLDPTLTRAAALLGEIAYHEGNLDVAISTYEAAVARDPLDRSLKERLESWKAEASSYRSFEAVKDDRFTVMFEGPVEQQLAAHATVVLGRAFLRSGTTLGAYPSNPINVILYTEKQFRDVTGAPEWAAGGFDGQIRLPVQGALRNPAEFDRVLTHELSHAMVRSVASRNVPAWLTEGLAMYFEGRDVHTAERTLTPAGVFVPLATLGKSFSHLTEGQATVAYAESLLAVTALVERIGSVGLAALLQDLDGGEPVDTAVQHF